MMGFGLIFTLVIVAAIAYALGWRPQAQNKPPTDQNNDKLALDILKERYARGEIGSSEYEEMRDDLAI